MDVEWTLSVWISAPERILLCPSPLLPADFYFKERLKKRNEELETLNAEARELESRIAENVAQLLEQE